LYQWIAIVRMRHLRLTAGVSALTVCIQGLLVTVLQTGWLQIQLDVMNFALLKCLK